MQLYINGDYFENDSISLINILFDIFFNFFSIINGYIYIYSINIDSISLIY